VPPSMPWINPYHEAQAYALLEENTYMSGPEIIRRRGADPHDVLDQQSAWLQRKREWGIAAKATTAAPADELSDPPDTDPNEQPPIKEAA
jgi:capsid protein